jgi:hypothetical protein
MRYTRVTPDTPYFFACHNPSRMKFFPRHTDHVTEIEIIFPPSGAFLQNLRVRSGRAQTVAEFFLTINRESDSAWLWILQIERLSKAGKNDRLPTSRNRTRMSIASAPSP